MALMHSASSVVDEMRETKKGKCTRNIYVNVYVQWIFCFDGLVEIIFASK